MLMTSIVAMAEGEKSDFDLNVFYDQMRLDNSGYKQYSVSLDDMEARGFISLNRLLTPRDRGYSFDYLGCGYWLYVCEPDIYLAKATPHNSGKQSKNHRWQQKVQRI